MVTAREVVRRWGGRAVGLTVTAIGLYVVAPGLLAVFGAWPRLSEVQPRWFVILVLLETASFATLWWLTRLALEPHRGDADERARRPPPRGRRAGARWPPRSWPGARPAR